MKWIVVLVVLSAWMSATHVDAQQQQAPGRIELTQRVRDVVDPDDPNRPSPDRGGVCFVACEELEDKTPGVHRLPTTDRTDYCLVMCEQLPKELVPCLVVNEGPDEICPSGRLKAEYVQPN